MAEAYSHESKRRRFEITDASARGISYFAIGLTLALAVILAVLWFALAAYLETSPAEEGARASAWSYADKSMNTILEDRQALEAQEAARLQSYQWLDREAGVARIPIERAMERVAEDGLPRWGDSETAKTLLDMAREKAPEDATNE